MRVLNHLLQYCRPVDQVTNYSQVNSKAARTDPACIIHYFFVQSVFYKFKILVLCHNPPIPDLPDHAYLS